MPVGISALHVLKVLRIAFARFRPLIGISSISPTDRKGLSYGCSQSRNQPEFEIFSATAVTGAYALIFGAGISQLS